MPTPKHLYIVKAYRDAIQLKGWTYEVGVFDTLERAVEVADLEAKARGGKYQFTVRKYELNRYNRKDPLETEILYQTKSIVRPEVLPKKNLSQKMAEMNSLFMKRFKFTPNFTVEGGAPNFVASFPFEDGETYTGQGTSKREAKLNAMISCFEQQYPAESH